MTSKTKFVAVGPLTYAHSHAWHNYISYVIMLRRYNLTYLFLSSLLEFGEILKIHSLS